MLVLNAKEKTKAGEGNTEYWREWGVLKGGCILDKVARTVAFEQRPEGEVKV